MIRYIDEEYNSFVIEITKENAELRNKYRGNKYSQIIGNFEAMRIPANELLTNSYFLNYALKNGYDVYKRSTTYQSGREDIHEVKLCKEKIPSNHTWKNGRWYTPVSEGHWWNIMHSSKTYNQIVQVNDLGKK